MISLENKQEKEELAQSTSDWFKKAQIRIDNLKKMTTMAIKEGIEPENVDERTRSLVHMLVGINESRERRKREVKELMNNIRKENEERRNEVKKIISNAKNEREEMKKVWIEVANFTAEKRKELNERRKKSEKF